jgi:hypothetical protein
MGSAPRAEARGVTEHVIIGCARTPVNKELRDTRS